MLLTSRKKLCSLAFRAFLLRQQRSCTRLSPHLPSRSPISCGRSSNTNWVPGQTGEPWRGHVGWKARCHSSEAPSTARCWSCGWDSSLGSDPFLVCASCRAVQPLDASVDYFQIFGIDRGYDIGEENLESKYKEWQKKLHPDLVHTKSEREKNYAAEQSARVIDARRTLSNTLSRATYLLELEGVNVDKEETLTDPELLTEVMEIREAVEEADDTRVLENIKYQIQEKMDSCSSSFAKVFMEQDFDAAVNVIKRMPYYEKALQEITRKI